MSWVSEVTTKMATLLAFHLLGEVDLHDYFPKPEYGKNGIAIESSVKKTIHTKLEEQAGIDVAQMFSNYTFVRFCITSESHTPMLLIESKGGPARSLESSVNEPLIKFLKSLGGEHDVTKKKIGIENSTITVSGSAAKAIFEEAGVKHSLTWAVEKALSELKIKQHEGKQ